MSRVLVVACDHDRLPRLLDYALETHPDSEFVILDVIDPRTRPRDYLDGSKAGQWMGMKRDSSDELDEFVARLGGQRDVSISSDVAYGSTANEVLERIDRGSFDRLLVDRHEESGTGRLLGRPIDRIVRRTPIPTTVVGLPDDRDVKPPRSVLVPIDESRQATAALDHACETFPSATITAFHAKDVIPWTKPEPAPSAIEVDDSNELETWRTTTVERAEALLDRARDRAARRGVDLRTVAKIGLPVREILSYVEANAVDHVCMGRTGWTDQRR